MQCESENHVPAGGTSKARPVDDVTRELALSARHMIEVAAGDVKFEMFEPIEVATQIVAGVNYFFKVRIAKDSYIHARLFRDLSGGLSCNGVQRDKHVHDPLVHF